MFMVLEFFRDNDRFNAPEIRSAKASLLYVLNISKAYSTTLIINKTTEKIIVQCHDCVAATDRCKHALAVLMWVHRRSEDSALTEIACY
ncbi:hypothetical protein P5V15_002693 [Pogonomyrmex californicus]